MGNKQLTRKDKIKASARKFRLETQKAINIAIVAAFGFLMALAWRDVIAEYVNQFTALGPAQGKLVIAIIITIVSVIGILIVTNLIKVEEIGP